MAKKVKTKTKQKLKPTKVTKAKPMVKPIAKPIAKPKKVKISKPTKAVKASKVIKKKPQPKPSKPALKSVKRTAATKPVKVLKKNINVKTKAKAVIAPVKVPKTKLVKPKKLSKKSTSTPPAVSIITAQPVARKFPKPPFPIKGPKVSLIPESVISPNGKKQILNKKFLEQQKQKILELRDILLDQMQGVAQDNLRSRAEGSEASAFGMHQADAGSDAYEKDFALSLLSQEQDALYEIEQALKRIEIGGYGLCEMSGKPIPVTRLEAIPFARFTRDCQEQAEKEQKGKHRWETAAQFMDSTDNFFEEEEEGDEEEKPKLKE